MKTISIRDLRQRWPEAEAALQLEHEIIITRDSKPVAKLVSLPPAVKARPRWNAKAHARWRKRVNAGKNWNSLADLMASREERDLIGRRK